MRIILADHHAELLRALKTMLEEQPEFNLVAEAADGEDLLILAEEHTPDLVLLDSELPGLSSYSLIARLRAIEPRPIVLVMSRKVEYSRALLQAGADAFVSKGDEPDWLLEKLYKYARQVHMKEESKKNKDS